MKQRYYLVKLYRGLGIKKINALLWSGLVDGTQKVLPWLYAVTLDCVLQDDKTWTIIRYKCEYGYFLLVRHLS